MGICVAMVEVALYNRVHIMDANDRLLRLAEELLQNRDDPRARQALDEAHAADIAHVLQLLPASDRATIFRSLGPEQAGAGLSDLDDAPLLGLVRTLDDVEVSQILDRMPAEHAADVVDELSTEHAEKILDLMEEERSEEIQEILEYPEDSAGGRPGAGAGGGGGGVAV